MSQPLELDPDYEQFCRETLSHPHPLYRRLRNEDPVHWSQRLGLWLVSRYEDVAAAVRDERYSTSRAGMYRRPLTNEAQSRHEPLLAHLSRWLLLVDGPDHTRLRKLVNMAFTPRMLKVFQADIEQLTGRLIDALPRGQPIDLMPVLCNELPTAVIATMLGVPEEQRHVLRRAVEKIASFSARGGPELARFAEPASEGLREAVAIFDRLIAARRHEPREDLLSALIAVEADSERLSQEELYSLCVFLFIAGHDTTAALLANGILALIEHPEQLELLQADLEVYLPTAVEEFLRYESSVPRAVRQAKVDVALHDKNIRAGDTVIFLIGSANRDPQQFPNPDRLDITRQPNRHVAFGFGPHFCLGAPLARMELQIAFRALLQQQLRFELVEQPQWRAGMGIRGVNSLKVMLT
jgi:cytochrome P450